MINLTLTDGQAISLKLALEHKLDMYKDCFTVSECPDGSHIGELRNMLEALESWFLGKHDYHNIVTGKRS